MKFSHLALGLIMGAGLGLLPISVARGNTFEISVGFSYSQSTFAAGSYQWSRRWGANVGYYIWSISEIEASYQDVYDRTRIEGFQDTTFNDRIVSVNWLQYMLPKGFPIQPYVKLGGGWLMRDASGTYASGGSPPTQVDSLTAVIGVGLKILVLRTLGLRLEGNSYLVGGVLSTWKDNFAVSSGISLYF